MAQLPEGRLVCDLGGTNMRIALAQHTANGTSLLNQWSTPLSTFSSFEAALADYLDEMRPEGRLDIAIGAAGPISGTRVKLTNADWVLNASKISPILRGGDVLFFNDLQPVARSIPALGPGDIEMLRHGEAFAGSACLAVNVGTGFGAAALHELHGRFHATATEAGHMARPALIDRDMPEVSELGETCEDLLSGKGVLAAYGHLAGATHAAARAPVIGSAADVFGTLDDDPIAMRTNDLFGYALGIALRDLILAHAAWGGVYLFGSVVKGWMEGGYTDRLQDGLDAIDAMGDRVGRVPIHRIKNEDAALLGLALL